MALIDKTVEIELKTNIKYYENLGYEIPKVKDNHYRWTVKRGTKIKIKTKDLTHGSTVKVNVKCDICRRKNKISWNAYQKNIKRNKGKYHCKLCADKTNLDNTNIIKEKLKNGKSFKQWCIDNNRQDILDLWDYDLNKLKPNEICYSSTKKYYFKCSRKLHSSELKSICNLTNKNKNHHLFCNACNSFAQWGIDNLDDDFLEKYWSDKNTLNPWEISHGTPNKKILIKCTEKDYHEDYLITPNDFINGSRCPYCFNHNGRKIHPKDSLGQYLIDNYGQEFLDKIWSNKNKKSPFNYAPMSNKEVWWKCPDKRHKEYRRSIDSSNRLEFRCPQCDYSKGEEKINNWLLNNNFIDITYEQNKLELYQNKNVYIRQKEFNGLLGTGGGNLSYDFYLPNYNLLIEFQGRQHEKYIPGFHRSKKDFEKQKEHDKRKKTYVKDHNIKLLEIWYWDFDDIEFILDKERR